MASYQSDISYRLICAVRDGRLETVRELISEYGLSYSAAWSDGYVLLRDALEHRRSEISKLLLRNNCKVNSKNQKRSETPLHIAVRNSDIEIIEMLLDEIANIDAENRIGITPLDIAADGKKMELVELLLNKGASFTDRNNYGAILLTAVETGYLQLVQHFLNTRACIDSVLHTSKFSEGYTPLCLAAEKGNEVVIKFLLSKGANIDAKRKDGKTPLYLAVEKGHEEIVMLLLEYGANVDAQDNNNKTILHLAVEKGPFIIIEDILKYCPDVNNKNNRSALHTAVYGPGRIYRKVVENLLEYGFTIDPEDVSNHKLLHTAVENGYLKIVERLLQYGADVNILSVIKYGEGCMPLHVATKNKREEIAKLLITYAADINAADETGKAPIFYAIENADLKMTNLLLMNRANVDENSDLLKIAVLKKCREIVEVLLENCADINASDKYGRTALHFTVLNEGEGISNSYQLFGISGFGFLYDHHDNNDDEEIVKLLLNRGANVNAQTQNGATALLAATQKGYVKIVEALLQYNADVNSTFKNDLTLLHFAAQEGNKVITKMLLHKGANVNARQTNRKTALHIATLRGHKEVVEVLLRCGAKTDFKIKNELTPLHIAAFSGNSEVVEFLLKFGADIDSRNINGETALHMASFKGYAEIVRALLNYGSDINIISKKNQTPLGYAKAGINSFYNTIANNYDSDYDEYYFNDDRGIPPGEEVLEILQQYIVKMETANSYDNFKMSCYNEFSHLVNKCNKEIAKMKSENFSNANVSFYDILTKGISRLAIYAGNENIVQGLGSDGYKIKYPIYASMIQSNFIKGKRRKELLERGYTFFHLLFNDFPHLPHNCTEKIFSYLSDEDLRFFLEDFRKKEGRKELLEQGYRCFHFTFNSFPQLPYNCIEKIFSYLNDEDLRILILL